VSQVLPEGEESDGFDEGADDDDGSNDI